MEALYSGKAVTIHPNDHVIATEQAAELLGVSRPTVVNPIEYGELEAIKVARHRRIVLENFIEVPRVLFLRLCLDLHYFLGGVAVPKPGRCQGGVFLYRNTPRIIF
ncbi:hypothetical protein FRC0195_01936 [Corynebacterium diphtheriae]|nr:hypothetical protein FRC0195_01936 [Corynebacterium diphtheriae]